MRLLSSLCLETQKINQSSRSYSFGPISLFFAYFFHRGADAVLDCAKKVLEESMPNLSTPPTVVKKEEERWGY